MGRTEFLTWKTITSEPTVGKGNTINESEMALFFECMQQCARKVLDTGRHCQRGDFSTVTASGWFGVTDSGVDGLLKTHEGGIKQTPNNFLSIQQKLNILRVMNQPKGLFHTRQRGLIAALTVSSLMLFAGYFYAYGQDKSGFPDGYDAVQAAPNSHRVIFENEFVRVLEVTVPLPGTTEPMHHHRWPSFFLDWDTGGGTPHIRYHRPDGSVRDSPSMEEPIHPGAWSAQWMKPEPNARHRGRREA